MSGSAKSCIDDEQNNSLAFIIDRPILDLLKIDPITPLEVTADGKQLIIASMSNRSSDTPDRRDYETPRA